MFTLNARSLSLIVEGASNGRHVRFWICQPDLSTLDRLIDVAEKVLIRRC